MNNTLVVKIGGSENVDTAEILHDIADIAHDRPVIIVHGVSERMARLSQERGFSIEMLESPGGHSSRYTPPPVRDLFVEAATQVNREIVNRLTRLGVASRGLTESVVVRGQRKSAVRAVVNGRIRLIRDDYTGRIDGVESQSLRELLGDGHLAVVPPFAISDDGLLNVDGDRAAAAVAGSIHAETLVILSNVRGLYRRYPDEDSFVHHVPASQIDRAMEWAQGRMKRKVLSAQTALDSGVRHVVIGDGRVSQPVTRALACEGTVFSS